MASESSAPSSVAGPTSTGKYAQKMIELQRVRHMLLTSVLYYQHPRDYVTKYFTSQGLFEEIVWHIDHADDEQDGNSHRYALPTWDSRRETFLSDVELLASLYNAPDLALSAILHFSCSMTRPARIPSPIAVDTTVLLDNAILSLCKTIAKDSDSGQDVASKLEETQASLHKIRAQFDTSIPEQRQDNLYFPGSWAFLIEVKHWRAAYMVVKKAVEGHKLPEELIQEISAHVCAEKSVWLTARKLECRKELKKIKAKQPR